MPLSKSCGNYRKLRKLHFLRQRPAASYGIAVGVVALAAAIRWAISDNLPPGLPFITFFPAIIIATFVGGLWPGVAALALSSLAAWYLFLPPAFAWHIGEKDTVALILFMLLNGLNLIVVAFLNVALERVLTEEEHVRTLIESAPNGIVVVNQQGTITLVNPAIEKLFGYKPSELIGQPVDTLVPERLRASHEELRKNYLREPRARLMGIGLDLHARRKDGGQVPVEVGLAPVKGSGTTGVLATVVDISERKRSQDRQRLLVSELRHRARNLLSVINAIVNRSLVDAPRAEKETVLGRLMALGHAYSMIADAAWEGAPLGKIIERTFEAFSDRVTVVGCDDVALSPAAAQNFALILHELATNALKDGSLSVSGGHVVIEGQTARIDGSDEFLFSWREFAGPPVRQPMRKGFGTTILMEVAKQFSSEVELTYDPKGLIYRLRVPLSAIRPQTAAWPQQQLA